MATFASVVFSDAPDRLYEAVAFGAAARARGDDVFFYFRGPALKRWVSPESVPASSAAPTFDGEEALTFLGRLRSTGKVRVYACSAWVRHWSLDSGAVASRCDATLGLVGFLAQVGHGPVLHF